MDPQQRLFLECAWEALEERRLRPGRAPGRRVGVFAGARTNTYLFHLLANPPALERADRAAGGAGQRQGLPGHARLLQAQPARAQHHACRRACSTSLVAVHLACQSLLDGRVRHGAGRRRLGPRAAPARATSTSRAAILSPDGHCRAFDAEAQGTVFGSGVGRGGAQAAGRRARRRRPHPRRDPRLGDQQRRRAQGRLHRARASRGRRQVIARGAGVRRGRPGRPSATSRPTAPARRWAIRSRSRR